MNSLSMVHFEPLLLDGMQGLTFRKKHWGQLAPKFSDLVASKIIPVKSIKS